MKNMKPGATRVNITTILCDGRKFRRSVRTLPNQFLSAEGIETVLATEATRVEEFFSGLEFRLVPLCGGNNFNFVQVPPESLNAGEAT